jgi:8-oxo-dGTP diphosphatase
VPRLVVAAAIVDHSEAGDRLLCARRSAPPRFAGRFELPGGKVEPGEDPVDALHREIAEELGVRIEVGALLPGPLDGDWPIVDDMTMRVWWARLVTGTPRALEDHDELRWETAADLTGLDWLDADVPIAAALARHLTAGKPGA